MQNNSESSTNHILKTLSLLPLQVPTYENLLYKHMLKGDVKKSISRLSVTKNAISCITFPLYF